MSAKVFLVILIVVALLVGVAVLMHTPGGHDLMRAVHGG